MGWNDSRGVSPGGIKDSRVSFCHGVILSWSHSVLDSSQDKMDSREVLQSLDGTTPKEVLLSLDRTTPEETFSAGEMHPGESFCPCIV